MTVDTRLHQKISLRLMTSRYQPVEGAAVVVEGEVHVPRNQLHFDGKLQYIEVGFKINFIFLSILYTCRIILIMVKKIIYILYRFNRTKIWNF